MLIVDLLVGGTAGPRCAGRLVAARQAAPGVERAAVDQLAGRVWCAPAVSPPPGWWRGGHGDASPLPGDHPGGSRRTLRRFWGYNPGRNWWE